MKDYIYDEVDDFGGDKIPFDLRPISRTRVGNKTPVNSAAMTKRTRILSIILMVCVAINLALGGLIIKLIINTNVTPVINSPTINITVDGDNTVAAASTKGKLSAVCVSAGLRSGISEVNYDNFFSLASRGAGIVTGLDKTAGTAIITTCYHVIENYTDEVYILFYGSYKPVKATTINYSKTYDIAVLKIEDNEVKASPCAVAEIADSSAVVEGEPAIAIGNPLALGISVSSGIISSPVNIISIEGISTRAIKVDTPINSGNSGGGLFNSKGQLIGIVNAKLIDEKIDNVGFAIPSNVAIGLTNSIVKNGNAKPRKASLPFTYSILKTGNSIDATGKLAQTIIVDTVKASGLVGVGTTPNIQSGDVLVSIKIGEKTTMIDNLYDLDDQLFGLDNGDVIELTLKRGTSANVTYQLKITAITYV